MPYRRWFLDIVGLPELRAGDVLEAVMSVHGGRPRQPVLRACKRADNRGHGRIETDLGEIDVGGIGNALGIAMISSDLEEEVLLRVVEAFHDVSPVRFARLADGAFEYWQNAADLSAYRGHPERLAGCSLVDDGLPPPLARQVVDTSRNPGRRVIRQDDSLVEGVGHVMWFGTDVFRILRRPLASLQEQGGDWIEALPRLWRVRWEPQPLCETTDAAVLARAEAFRDFAFGDPSRREPVPCDPPRGAVAHRACVRTPVDGARHDLLDWADETRDVSLRMAQRATNPATGAVIQMGEDVVRWHGHADARPRDLVLHTEGLVAARPDASTLSFLESVAGALGLVLDVEAC